MCSERSTMEDPSCIVEMLEDFRSGGSSLRRLSKINFSSLSQSSSAKRKSCDRRETEVTPSKCPKEEVASSPWEFNRTRGELLDARMQITTLESQINKMHLLRKEMEVMFEKDRENLQKQLEKERSMVKEMENRLNVIRNREGECKQELLTCKSQLSRDKLKFEELIYNLQKENSKLKDNIMELEQNSHPLLATEKQIKDLEAEVSCMTQELVDIKARNSELEKRLLEEVHRQAQIEKLEQNLQSTKLKLKELEQERENHEEEIAFIKSQQMKLLRHNELEKEVVTLREENRHLKEAVPNKLLLEEMVQDLQSRQAGIEEKEQELASVKGQLSHTQLLLEEWQTVARDYCEGTLAQASKVDPIVIRKRMEELQQKVLVLTADVSELKSQLNESRQKYDLLNNDRQRIKKDAEKSQAILEQHANRFKLLQKKIHLITKERDSYRSQLDAYEKDLTISSSSSVSNHQQRIETLEKFLSEYRELLEKMEGECEKGKGRMGSMEAIEKIHRLECERNILQQEKEQLLKRKDELEQQLEYRAIKGDFNAAQSKILHFRMNPSAEADKSYEDEIKKLRTECAHLKQRVKLLEEGNTADITRKVEEEVATSNAQEVQELQELVQSQDLKMQRMKELFLSSAQEYREVCYILFGYKMDRTQHNVYKLSNMYAESPDDYLMFKFMPDGTLDMVETEYSSTLSELIDVHLHQHHSFPLFLGAITMELFNRQTMMPE